MRDEELYALLKGPEEQDWFDGVAHFMKLKIASGGLLPGEAEEIAKHGEFLARTERVRGHMTKEAGVAEGPITPEEIQKAVRAGTLSAIRGEVSGDIARANMMRRKRGERWSKALGTLGGMAAGGVAGHKMGKSVASTALGMLAGGAGGHTLGKTVGEEIDRKRLLKPKGAAMEKNSDFDKEAALTTLKQKIKTAFSKRAQDEPALPIQAAPPQGLGGEGTMDPAALEEFLQMQQQANEAEFFKQQAEEAGAQAAQLHEHATMLTDQNQQLQQQTQQVQQESQMKDQAAAQQTQMASEQANMAQQDAMMARNESLGAQQQTLALRNAVTQYRQQLMDLLSQDPTQILGPPAVPQGPMPGPQGAPPPGAMPGPEQGGPPGMPPEMAQGAPPPGAEQGGPPMGALPEMPTPPKPPSEGSGVTVNVKQPGAAKPKKEQPAAPAA